MRLNIELATFEKMANQVKTTAEKPLQLVGYSLFYPIYSTWDGRSMYLEDLYVTPDHRGTGQGKRLWKHVTKVALDWDCKRLHLAVLGWNTFAKDFYTRHGLIDLTETEDWHLMRMTRPSMETFVKDL